MNLICAFSSDYRELYKADIYRSLALPHGQILHFRYKLKYVDDNLLRSDAKLSGKKVVIFYTHGNAPGAEKVSHVSVREASIVDHFVSKDTDVFHVYLKLGDFCNVQVDTANSLEKLPVTKFISEISCTYSLNNSNWQARVSAIKDLLPELIYFRVKGVTRAGKQIELSYSTNGTAAYYELQQGKRHIMHLAIGNPNGSDSKVDITESGEDIALNIVRPLETSAQFDDVDVPLIVHTLQVSRKPALMTFKPISKGQSLGEYATNLEMSIKSGLFRPLAFGFLSTIAFSAVFFVQSHNPSDVPPSNIVLAVSAIVFWICTSFLYLWFNKK